MKRFFILVLALMIVTTGGICSNEKQPLKKHVDPTGSFSFDVRGRWLVADNKNYPNVIGWFLVGDKNDDKEFVAAEVIVTRVEAESVPEFDQYVELEKELIDRNQAIKSEAAPVMRMVDGRKAFRRQLSFSGAEFSNKSGNRFGVQYYIDGTDSIWGVTIVTTSQNRHIVSEIEETMLKSFKFLKGDKTPAVSEIEPEPVETAVTAIADVSSADIALKGGGEDEAAGKTSGDATHETVKAEGQSSGAEIAEENSPEPLNESIGDASIGTGPSNIIEVESPEESEDVLDSTLKHPIWLPKIGNE